MDNSEKEAKNLNFDFLNSLLTHKYLYEALLISSILLYTAILSLYTIIKHNAFYTYAWDLGIFNQAIWTTSKLGKLFYYTPELHLVETGTGVFFGVHFSPILFLLVPFYYFFPNPQSLLVMQSVIIGLTAVPIYFIGKNLFNKRVGLILSILFLLNPIVHGINSYDFHVQIFLPFFIVLSFYFYLNKKWWYFLLSLVFILMVQEQTSYLVVFYGLSLFFLDYKTVLSRVRELIGTTVQKTVNKSLDVEESDDFKILIPFIVIFAGVGWYFFSSAMINFFNPNIPEILLATRHFEALEIDKVSEIPLKVVRNPSLLFDALTVRGHWYNKLTYLMFLFIPFIFIPFLEPFLLIPLIPWLAISLLSNYPPYYRYGFQYQAYTVPFIFISFMLGLYHITGKSIHGDTNKKIFTLIILVNIFFSVSFSPISPLIRGAYPSPAYQRITKDKHTEYLQEILALVPDESSILTQDNIFPHVSSRLNAYVLIPPVEGDTPEWKKAINDRLHLKTDYLLIDLNTDPHGISQQVYKILGLYDYNLFAFKDNIVLFRRDYYQPPVIFEPINKTYHPEDFFHPNGELTELDGKSISRYSFKNPSAIYWWYGPYEVLPPGNYVLKFRIVDLAGDTLDSNISSSNLIKVDASTSGLIHNSTDFKIGDLRNNNNTIILKFEVSRFEKNFEFRGQLEGNITDLGLESVELLQESFISRKSVSYIYDRLLDRYPNITELDYWAERAERIPYYEVEIVEQILESEEYNLKWWRKLITPLLYYNFFNSSVPSEDYYRLTENIIEDNLTQFEIFEKLAGDMLFNTSFNSLTDSEFLNETYQSLLRRLPDEGGYEYWLERLKNGTDRAEIMINFYLGDEYNDTNSGIKMIYGMTLGINEQLPDSEEFMDLLTDIFSIRGKTQYLNLVLKTGTYYITE